MTRDEIVRMAREAGLTSNEWVPDAEDEPVLQELARFAALVATAEREACARECEIEASVTVVNASEQYQDGRSMGATACYHAISARGTQ